MKTASEFELQSATQHLPHFELLRDLSGLQGTEYTPILKGVYYSLLGVILRERKIRVGQLKTDPRISLTIPLHSGQGKKNLKNLILKVLDDLGYSVDLPLSFHSQQLIGKVINRGTPKSPIWMQNKGFLGRDYLIFDEAFRILTSHHEDLQESRRAIRIAKDCIGDNPVQKKSVNNTFEEAERISYCPKVTITQFLQPRRVPENVVQEGDLRRDLVLYVSCIAEKDKAEDYQNRLFKRVNESEILEQINDFLREVAKRNANAEFIFTEGAIKTIGKLHLELVNTGFHHSEKGASFTATMDWTLQDFLVKMSCIISGTYHNTEVGEAAVELAFMDLFEFFQLQLDYINQKVKGYLDYGENWLAAKESDKNCLEWLWEQDAVSEEKSRVSIQDFCKAIAHIKKVSYDGTTRSGQARHVYDRFKKKEQWIDSKQIGQHDSRVWLTLDPKIVGAKTSFEGVQGVHGAGAYNSILSNLDDRIKELKGLHTQQSTLTETISEADPGE